MTSEPLTHNSTRVVFLPFQVGLYATSSGATLGSTKLPIKLNVVKGALNLIVTIRLSQFLQQSLAAKPMNLCALNKSSSETREHI